MLYLRSWLEDYIDLSGIENHFLSDLLSQKSGEVEEIYEVNDYFYGKVVVGQVQNLRPHPDAEKLQIFDVDLGNSSVQIISGAKNITENMHVAVALEGAVLPYLSITPRKMRGLESAGMCVGKSELGLETEFSSGLWELDQEFLKTKQKPILGQSICKIFPHYFPPQTVIDIKYLQDRLGSLGNHIGLALEIAVCLGQLDRLKPRCSKFLNSNNFWQEFQLQLTKFNLSDKDIQLNDPTNYAETFFLFELEVDKQGDYILPHQMQIRMHLTKRNLVGGLTDLSNYLLADVGQPSHFFSQEKLDLKNHKKQSWTIQKLTKEKNFAGLGQLKRKVLPVETEVLVSDSVDKILAIPGISGSEATKIETHDKNILIEIANFPAQKVARNSFRIGYRSEGARIWNSGVNILSQLIWLSHFLEILESQTQLKFNIKTVLSWVNPNSKLFPYFQTAENLLEIFHGFLDYSKSQTVKLNLDSLVARLDGRSVKDWQENLDTCFKLLGDFEQTEREVKLLPRLFYRDIYSQEDVLFAISRLIGFSELKKEYLKLSLGIDPETNFWDSQKLKDFIRNFGFYELINRPFVSKKETWEAIAESSNKPLQAISSHRQDQNYLRDSLLSSLLKALSTNLKQGEKEPKVFEIAKIYTISPTNKLQESLTLGLAWQTLDPYLGTSILNLLSKHLATEIIWLNNTAPLEHPNLGLVYKFEIKKSKGSLIQLRNSLKKSFELPLNKSIWYLEIDIKHLRNLSFRPTYRDESQFSTINRTYSIFLRKTTKFSSILSLVKDLTITDCQIHLKPLERFEEKTQDVFNFKVEFVSYIRTLESQEVENWQNELLQKLTSIDDSISWR